MSAQPLPNGPNGRPERDDLTAEIEAAALLAFPAALHHAVSEWHVLGSAVREWCLWTADDSQQWTKRLRAASRRELLAVLRSYPPSTRLRVFREEQNRSAIAAHSQRAARRREKTSEI